MKLLSFVEDGRTRLGVRTERGVLDVARAPGAGDALTLDALLTGGQEVLARLADLTRRALEGTDASVFRAEETLTFAPCVSNPGKIICVGTNYRRHAVESRMPIPENPVLFSKFNSSLAAHGEEITIPTGARQVDYEAELAFVIGKTARHVAREDALNHVFGYCNANDLSERDWQFRTTQWLLGKACDGFCPLGPYLVTADEIPDPNRLGIRTFVNGELRQNSNTQDMIFRCDELISYISRHMTLLPGDVVLTGTPEGVVFGYPEDRRVWLKDGDEMVIEVEGLGRLVNRMVV